MAFTHLHLHTEYSLLDGMASIKRAVAKAKALGMDSLAITDHGVMFGVVDFYKECKAAGIRPILGCEVYTAKRSLHDKDPIKDKNQGHLILLAKNDTGYHNLMKLVSLGFTEGFYYKPRIDKEVLRRYHEGLVCLSACIAGEVQHRLLMRDYSGAKREIEELKDIFGDDFYLEIQNHHLDSEAQINPFLIEYSKEFKVPLVATNDVHYIDREDNKAHEVLLAIQTATSLDDPNRMSFPNDEFYLKSEAEMRELFPNLPDAIERSHEIAEKCEVELEFGKLHLPDYKVPEGYTADEYLRKLCCEGMEKRFGEGWREMSFREAGDQSAAEDETLGKRLEYELATIEQMGYVEYFLIVLDFISYARSKEIMVGPGRGSAAGSLVAYALRITDVNPIRYSLIFERFLNPERVSMPDIDVDFCYERRGEVIDYVIEKYGEDKVSQIISFGTLKAKAAVRDVGRALGVSYAETDAIAKAIPFGLDMTIDKALETNPELAEMYRQNERVSEVIDMSKALEGMPRHASTHAAGVVISKKALDEYVPLYSGEKGISTQFPKDTIEELGLLKMDFLGLRNLTVIRDALAMIKENTGDEIIFENMEMNDPKVFETIGSGNTEGIFQLESTGMTAFMRRLKPDSLDDIIAGISLYRPGPMKMGFHELYVKNKQDPEKIEYVHEKLRPILSVTYGCLVYQEQVMQIVRDLAGYSYGRSDLVRRAMSKKKHDVMVKEQEYFVNGKLMDDGTTLDVPGCVRNGVPREAADKIFEQMVGFAEYAFNKSHAACYAVLAYQTAYLKTYYPTEFMAALLSSEMGNATQIAKYTNNCRSMGIKILPPNINKSGLKFSVEDGNIRYGLLAIKNLGEKAILSMIESREKSGPFSDLHEFINALDLREVNKKAVESLILAGALDDISENRAQLRAGFEKIFESAQNARKQNLEGQMSLFNLSAGEADIAGGADLSAARNSLPRINNFEKKQLLALEKEMTGLYLSAHPLDEYKAEMDQFVTVTAADLERAREAASDEAAAAAAASSPATEGAGGIIREGTRANMAGLITHKRTLITKSGRMMAFLDVEDLYGSFDVVVFSNVYEKCARLLDEDSAIAIKGHINFRDEAPSLIADDIFPLEQANESPQGKSGATPAGSGYVRTGGGNARTASSGAASAGEAGYGSKGLVKLRIPAAMPYKETLEGLKLLIEANPGEADVLIYSETSGKRLKGGDALRAEPSLKFIETAELLLGKGNVKVING